MGVEEEFLLVDPRRLTAVAAAPRVLGPDGGVELAAGLDGEVDAELNREQVETGSAPHTSLEGLRSSLVALRRAAAEAARAEGVLLAATATSPAPTDPTPTPKGRYRRMYAEFGLTAREQLTCGCHVHVSIDSPDEAVGALDRLRPYLAPLVALSANSPFWHGEDTGYDSYRTQVWQRWPTAGPTGPFGSPAAYDQVVADLVGSGAALDEGMIYFDVRLSRRYPTLELRVADVCLSVDDAVLIAALARALVTTAAREWRAGRPVLAARPEQLRAASWRAARHGLSEQLLDVSTTELVPARVLVDRLLERLRPALAEVGDLDAVTELLDTALTRGNGAARQRRAYAERHELGDVVSLVARETVP
jgi:carboxylate-amine ligase